MTSVKDYRFMGKYFIKADIRLITALHIGGTEEGFQIGGLDNPVIKDPMTDIPYIPGSSLKGKMRSLLEWVEKVDDDNTCITAQLAVQEEECQKLINKMLSTTDEKEKEKLQKTIDDFKYKANPCECGKCRVCIVFGISAKTQKGRDLPGPTRLTVLDAFPKRNDDDPDDDIKQWWQVKEWEKMMGEGIYTEIKTENSIDRLTSAANPRPMERVPTGSIFTAEFIYDVYCPEDIQRLKILFQGMMLLEDSTLGGGGSRGSGRIRFENITITKKDRSYYVGGEEVYLHLNLNGKELKTPKDFVENFDEIFKIK